MFQRLLPDHTKQIVGNDRQFQHQLIGFKLPGGESLHIHVGLDLAVELFTFPVGVIGLYDLIVRPTEIVSPCIHLNVCFQQNLAELVYCTLNNLVRDPHADCFMLALLGDVFNILPRGTDINCLPFTRMAYICNILAAALNEAEPILLCLASAQIALYEEPAAVFQENTEILFCVVPGIHTDQKRFFRHFMAQPKRFLQKSWRSVLAVLTPFAKLTVCKEAFRANIGYDRCIPVLRSLWKLDKPKKILQLC